MTPSKNFVESIETYLCRMDGPTRRRGRNYYTHGQVLNLYCVEPDHLYSAQVRGGADYDVALEFSDGTWLSECTCPMESDCKHVAAALLKLQNDLPANIPLKAAKPPAKAAKAPAKAKKKPPGVPQPPKTPLYERFVAHLGRELKFEEASFVRQVQNFYQQTNYRKPNEGDFSLISGQPNHSYWQELKIFPVPPPDDFFCWLYLAHELQKRNIAYPEFMQGITDLTLVEAELAAWERQQEVVRWQQVFSKYQAPPSVSDAGLLDMRLMLHADEARLQWRTAPDAPFADLKQKQASNFATQFEHGSVSLTPETLPLWSTVYKPWQYENWWSYKYENASARPTLNRLLRLPLPPDRVVTADEKPLVRAPEPLRFRLRPPQNGDADYEMALVQADDLPPAEIHCTLLGRPTLYLTAAGLFAGPPSGVLNTGSRQAIPALALETHDGLRFLQSAGVPFPDHLAQRVRNVPVIVTLSCALKQTYPGSAAEDILIQVVAEAPGLEPEKFTPQGWLSLARNSGVKKLKLEKGVIPLHDRAAQRHFPHQLEMLGVKWDGYVSAWKLRLTKKTPETFVPWLKSLPKEIEVLLDRELASLRDEPVSGSVSLDVTESTMDWFDLKVVLNVGDTKLTPEELKLLLNARGGYVRLGKKGWRRLQFNLTPEEDEQLSRLGLDARDFSAAPQRFHALQLADDAAKKFLAPERVEKIQRRVSELKTRVSPALPSAICAELRPYQTEGYHFLAYLTANRFGGVLADDMGLGKTVQTLAWLAWLRETAATAASSSSAPTLPSLVVCPKSVSDNWEAEAQRFYTGLRVRRWQGDPAEELAAARASADLIVINYSQLRFLSPAIAKMSWHAVILDEAQYIKNPDSQTAQAARALTAEHRLALTGTPIENRLLDLWSIFSFAMPGALGHRTQFLRRFNAQDDPLARRRLAARVRPFLLRRTKTQVAKDLPDRVEEDLLCEMEGEQRALYRAELKRARQLILGLQSNQQLNDERFNILTSLLRLRQICCHPALVDGKLDQAESAKVAALEDLLEPLMEEGHKVLVFSQFVTMLDLLRQTVKQHEWAHFYLSGETENRGDLVREFQAAKGGAVFLISLKAGGFGLNLTAASYVVLFDPWWNPAVENQAIDRTHRIGQTSKVMAYRLLVRDSIEQKIRALQKQKATLMDDVLGEERFAQSLTLDDLRFLFSE
jgi:hypothetical protein